METMLVLAQAQAGKPMLIVLAIGALLVLVLAFKVTRFVMKMVLLLAAFTALAVAAWLHLGAHAH